MWSFGGQSHRMKAHYLEAGDGMSDGMSEDMR